MGGAGSNLCVEFSFCSSAQSRGPEPSPCPPEDAQEGQGSLYRGHNSLHQSRLDAPARQAPGCLLPLAAPLMLHYSASIFGAKGLAPGRNAHLFLESTRSDTVFRWPYLSGD